MTRTRVIRSHLSHIDERLQAIPDAVLYVLLAFGVILFSLPALDLDFLISDDLIYYNLGIEGGIQANHFKRMLLAPLILYLSSQAMAVSLTMTRALVVLLGMVPVAIVAYLSYRTIFRLPRMPAFFAALLPQMLPSQVYIPVFVIGSYTVWGMLFIYSSLLSSFRFLETTKWRWFFLSGIFYLSAVETTELSVFLLIPMLLVVFGSHPVNKTSLTMAGSLAGVAAYKFLYVVFFQSSLPTSAHPFDLAVALGRMRHAVGYSIPAPGLNHFPYFPAFLFLFIAMGFLLHLRKSADQDSVNSVPKGCLSGSHPHGSPTFIYLFGFLWFACSVAPFAVSYYFTHRYFYPAAQGLCLLIVMAAWSWLSLARSRLFFLLAMVALTVFSGNLRVRTLEGAYAQRKEASAPLNRVLRAFNFPDRSQIVVVGKGVEPLGTHGYWNWSSGYLRYATGRSDVAGQMGEEKGFYDPFNRQKRARPNQMGGLSLQDPLFAFRYEGNRVIQVSYCLQWGHEKDPETWTLFSMDPVRGALTPFRSGKGEETLAEAMKELEALGVEGGEVLWAGPLKEEKQS